MLNRWKRLFAVFGAWLIGLYYRDFWLLRQVALRNRKKTVVGHSFQRAYNLYCERHGAYIPLEAKFAGRPCFPHGILGVFISRGAMIGKDCVIFQQVTIGSDTLGGGAKSPRIGDCCYIGAGAKVIGGVTVGSHTRIGANCCVYKDVAAFSVCVLAPTRVIQKQNLNNTFYSNEMGETEVYFKDGEWHHNKLNERTYQ